MYGGTVWLSSSCGRKLTGSNPILDRIVTSPLGPWVRPPQMLQRQQSLSLVHMCVSAKTRKNGLCVKKHCNVLLQMAIREYLITLSFHASLWNTHAYVRFSHACRCMYTKAARHCTWAWCVVRARAAMSDASGGCCPHAPSRGLALMRSRIRFRLPGPVLVAHHLTPLN